MIEALVIATHNLKKAGEMAAILGRRFPAIQMKVLAEYEGAPEPDEVGSSYAENATIKALSASSFTKEWALADDAGLEIDALGGEPGVFSKRFGGEGLSFADKMALILKELSGVPEVRRSGRFRCCVALAGPSLGGGVQTFEAVCEGRIAEAPSGTGGFGYDPIFFLPDLGCTMAQLSPDGKHQVSHRGKVLSSLGDWLESNGLAGSPRGA